MDEQKKTGDYYDKIPRFHEEGTSKLREQISKGFGALLIIGIGIILYFSFLRFSDIYQGVSSLMDMLTPVVYGLVIAYLLNPMMKKTEAAVLKIGGSFLEGRKDVKRAIRIISIFISLIVFLLIIFFLFYLIIPEVLTSAYNLILTLPDQVNASLIIIMEWEVWEGEIAAEVEVLALEAWSVVKNWLQTDLLNQANAIMFNVTGGVVWAVGWVLDVIMGLILSIYLLMSKELFLGQAKKTIYAFMPTRQANITLHILKKSNSIFGGFIIGKIIDSILMGIITFIVLSIMNMPYTLLVSVIIGTTNVIPYFGPFIGAIPCAILILLQSPIQGLYFIIYIIILQQIDGNIIGPKILGDSTGLSSFWVIIGVILGSGLFGVVGMVIGVPLFAVFYYIAGLFVNQKLERKNLPTDSCGYGQLTYVDEVTGEFKIAGAYDKGNQNENNKEVEKEEKEEE